MCARWRHKSSISLPAQIPHTALFLNSHRCLPREKEYDASSADAISRDFGCFVYHRFGRFGSGLGHFPRPLGPQQHGVSFATKERPHVRPTVAR